MSRVIIHQEPDRTWTMLVDGEPKITGMTRADASIAQIQERTRLEGPRTDPRSEADDD